MMDTRIEPMLLEHKPVFVQMMNLYNYDFTEYEDVDINEHGYYDYSHTDAWWNEDNRHPFFIRTNNKLAGFVLVDNHCRYIDKEAHSINEFFVMKKYRRMGIGSFAARAVFDLFRGKWEVRQLPNNIRAQKFWKAVIATYTQDTYQEIGSPDEEWVGFLFDNSVDNTVTK